MLNSTSVVFVVDVNRGVTIAFSFSLWFKLLPVSRSMYSPQSSSSRWNVMSRATFDSNLNSLRNCFSKICRSGTPSEVCKWKTLFLSRYVTRIDFSIQKGELANFFTVPNSRAILPCTCRHLCMRTTCACAFYTFGIHNVYRSPVH